MSEQNQWWEASGAAVYELRGDRQFEALTGNEANTLADYLNDLEALASGLYRALEKAAQTFRVTGASYMELTAEEQEQRNRAMVLETLDVIEQTLATYKAQSRG